jgi:hypothetical protein
MYFLASSSSSLPNSMSLSNHGDGSLKRMSVWYNGGCTEKERNKEPPYTMVWLHPPRREELLTKACLYCEEWNPTLLRRHFLWWSAFLLHEAAIAQCFWRTSLSQILVACFGQNLGLIVFCGIA